jgi:hypothetical protein
MFMAKTETNKEVVPNEKSSEIKHLMVSFKGEKKKFEFEHGIVCGRVKGHSEDEISTIISGFQEVDDLVTVMNNILLQTYSFLKDNADNTQEEIIGAMKATCETIFEGIQEGIFEEYFNSISEE